MNISDNHQSLPFANLPMVIREGVFAFKTEHERNIFLFSSISALSGLCTKVVGEYRQQQCRPNLFLFVLAPAASGKGVMNFARKLIYPVHKSVLARSQRELDEYNALFSQAKKSKDESSLQIPNKPPFQVVLLPANCSSAKLYAHLHANGNNIPAIMIESELDTLAVANQSEWGNFSDLLRKCFHNEMVSYSRKTGDEYFEIPEPRPSVSLSGTNNQLRNFVDNAEDGLLSRFLVYNFTAPPEWSSVAPCRDCINLDEHFAGLGHEVEKYYTHLQEHPLTIELTENQWQRLDHFGEDRLYDTLEEHEVGSLSIVKRHALMVYKVCMVLTALRAAEHKFFSPRVQCSDTDFAFALELVNISLKNSLEIFSSFPQKKAKAVFAKERYLALLPDAFPRREGILIGMKYGLSERTSDRWLNWLVDHGFLAHQHGKYKKQ